MTSTLVFKTRESAHQFISTLKGTPIEITPQLEEQLQYIPLEYIGTLIMGEISESIKAVSDPINRTKLRRYINIIANDVIS
jgi:hypothetical protein